MVGGITFLAFSANIVNAADSYQLHRFEKHHLAGEFFSEGAAIGDFNKDGHGDIVAGPFWFAGPDFTERHVYYEPKPFDPLGYSNNFFAFAQDINRDGWDDILILGFPGADGSWYANPRGEPGMWERHQVVDVVDNESPTFADITGDGQPEIICSQDGYYGYASPNWNHPELPWKFIRVSDQSAGGRFTHGLGIGDVNNDGRMDLIETNGWWEQPATPTTDGQWTAHKWPFSRGAAQMYAYDVNGDGLNDVVTSLEAHGYGLVWHEQKPSTGNASPEFVTHVIMGRETSESPYGLKFSQLHAVDLVDMDGDGLKDIVTGKRHWAHGPNGDAEPNAPAVLYWFKLQRGKDGAVDWVPYQIDADSGIGTQVLAGDINGDSLPDVVVGNKKGIFVHIHRCEDVSQADWAAAQPQRVQ